MKLSLAWIFDHIETPWRKDDVQKLVNLFNQKTAEIEAFYPVTLDKKNLFVGQVTHIGQEVIELQIPELKQTVELTKRVDVQLQQWFLIKRKDNAWRYAIGKDFHSETVAELPPVYVDHKSATGSWKDMLNEEDYILEVDNKSITHRPDLWSHRGFAREVAILLHLPLKKLDTIIAPLPVITDANASAITKDQPFAATIKQPALIKRFAYAYFDTIEYRSSLSWMLSRLCRIDAKPINLLVDMTNYVMFDVGQPLHAFDAEMIATDTLEAGLAQAGQEIALLDNDRITLTAQDVVITDTCKPIALAGIMGGKETAVTSETTAVLLESANFDATTIRTTAARHKKRTESAARFEKTLDPNQNIIAIKRLVKLLQDAGVNYQVSAITSLGQEAQPLEITITHDYITQSLGVGIPSETIVLLLQALECYVTVTQTSHDITYSVWVPTFRCTKDIKIKEDLLEEIGRLYGYSTIPFILPQKETQSSDLRSLYQQRHIKRLLSFGLQMREVKNYAFYNENFLQALCWHPQDTVSIQSPISEQYKQLVTSLIPGLLANIQDNYVAHNKINFFEWARIWQRKNDSIIESSELAAVVYSKESLSFYDIKEYVQQLVHMMHLPVTWQRVNEPTEPWFAPYQTAYLTYKDTVIGTVGIIDHAFTHTIFTGHAAAFSLDGAFFKDFKAELVYHPLSKYPAVERDISMMVPLTGTVEQITQQITAASTYITDVTLIDFFTKAEWRDQKSLSFRCTLQDATKTLTHEEVEYAMAQVIKKVQSLGVQIR